MVQHSAPLYDVEHPPQADPISDRERASMLASLIGLAESLPTPYMPIAVLTAAIRATDAKKIFFFIVMFFIIVISKDQFKD